MQFWRAYKLSRIASKIPYKFLTLITILSCSFLGGNGIGSLEYSDIQYRLCVSPASRVMLIYIDTYSMFTSLWTCRIFIADDFTLNVKLTYFESVVKSSNITHGSF